MSSWHETFLLKSGALVKTYNVRNSGKNCKYLQGKFYRMVMSKEQWSKEHRKQ